MNIGERIKTIREWLGISSGKLSEMSGCSLTALSQYEANKRIPTLKHFKGICKALEIPYALLLDGINLEENQDDERN